MFMPNRLIGQWLVPLTFLGTSAFGQVPATRTVALTGRSGADLTAEQIFTSFGAFRLNQRGQVAFYGRVQSSDPTLFRGQALFKDTADGRTASVFRDGDAVASFEPGVVFDSIRTLTDDSRDLQLNDSGQVAFVTALSGPRIGNLTPVLFAEREGAGLTAIARVGATPPGFSPQVTFYTQLPRPTFQVQLDNNGRVAINARLLGAFGAMDTAIFSDRDTSELALVAREGDQAPGVSVGGVYADNSSFSRTFDHRVNGSGRLAFQAYLLGGASLNGEGIFSDAAGGGIQAVALGSTQAPDLAPGVQYRQFINLNLNDGGQVAFQASLTNNSVGVFAQDRSNNVRLVAMTRSQAAGLPTGVQYADIGYFSVSFSDRGHVAFQARLQGPPSLSPFGDNALFAHNSRGELSAVIRRGDAPEGLGGATFFRMDGPSHINSRAQVAFLGTFRTPAPSFQLFDSLFVTDLSGELVLIAAEGRLFDTNADPLVEDLRTVADLGSDYFQFNNRGEIAFLASFTDGSSGLFIVSVPNPAALALLIPAAGLAIRRRR